MKENAAITIGLTGNIATGKSVVRRMLSNCGALDLDADLIAHRTLYPDGAAYLPVIKTFGEQILTENGQISRSLLGEIVFSNPSSLASLEALIHPAVSRAIRLRLSQSSASLRVIEAIKLLESDLKDVCDSLWVTEVSFSHQMERLLLNRKMTEREAHARISAQAPHANKIKHAAVVINTEGSFEQTWQQIQQALNDTINSTSAPKTLPCFQTEKSAHLGINRPLFECVAEFWQLHVGKDLEAFYKELGFRMVLPVLSQDRLKSLLIWENWNFTATLTKILPDKRSNESVDALFEAFTTHALQKQCEILLLPKEIVREMCVSPAELGFEALPSADLTYPAWQQAARKMTASPDDLVWVKILQQPINLQA